jgi:endonuclease I/methionine-rich copper-binding protein CopC
MRILFRGALLALCCSSAAWSQSVSITGGAPAVESFDSLANTGTTNTTLPTGWLMAENAATGTYSADDGTVISGSVYSYGASMSTERAFGSLRSGSTAPMIGARLQNDSGGTLSELLFAFTKEQWRVGNTSSVDRMDFQYSLNATSILDNAATWVDVDALDVTSIITSGAAIALDGNAPANRAAVSATFGGFTLNAGAQMYVRWVDFNAVGGSGNDDGLAIDDFSVGLAVDNPPQLTASTPANGASGVAVGSPITLTFSEAVTTTDPWFVLDCGAGAVAGTLSGSGNTRSFDPTADLPFNTSCTVTLTAANIVDTDGSADALTGTASFSFTTAVDLAPSVTSVSPIENATGVNINANLSVAFSEPVTPTLPNWLALSCTNSGAHPVTIGGGPTTWTVNPDADFDFSETCTATIAAANVQDQDGLPDPMAAPKTWSFTTSADLAPTVQSTFPVDGAVNVAVGSNLTVTFSEAVTTSAGAFVIACGATTHTYVATSGDQTSFTLDPDSDFAPDTACTLTIVAALVADVDGTPTAMGGDVVIDFTTSTGIAGYYERVDDSSCRALRSTLHGVIDDHSAVAYSDSGNTWTPGDPSTYDVWEVLNLADEDPLDPSKVLDIYRNESYAKISGGTGVYNREHVWPNSQGFNDIQTLDGFPYAPYVDTHMLMASNTTYNSNRSSRVFATCNASCTRDDTIFNAANGDGGGPTAYPMSGPPDHNWYTAGNDGGSGSYEVWDFRRGDLARAMLYMDVRYEGGRNSKNFQREPDLILTDNRANIVVTPSGSFQSVGYSGLLTPILAWAQADLPTAAEGLRNDVVESVQGNRNPFVDHPEWIPIAFATPCTGPDLVAVDDDFTTPQNTTLNRNGPNDIGVLNDDKVYAGNPTLSASLVSPPSAGTLSLQSNGQFTYVPNPGFCGNDSFVYQASNGTVSGQAIAHITVTGSNCEPVLPDDVFENGFE